MRKIVILMQSVTLITLFSSHHIQAMVANRIDAYIEDFTYLAGAGLKRLVQKVLEEQHNKLSSKKIIKALLEAYHNNHVALVKLLSKTLNHDELKQQIGFDLDDELICQARQGNQSKVCCLLAMGADVTHRSSEKGRTALHEAAAWGHNTIVVLLLKATADVNAYDMFKQTALHRAYQWGQTTTIALLSAHGANPNLVDCFGKIPCQVRVKSAEEGS